MAPGRYDDFFDSNPFGADAEVDGYFDLAVSIRIRILLALCGMPAL